ncbi:MAG TPA: hypothetical protein VHB77_04525 [Planctomycetaceae bacterium]|nr:hypothetical protein [Planctomycetaceae bacterium]
MDSFDPYQQWLGISRREQPANRYRLIGVGVFEFDPEIIRESAERQIESVRKHGRGPHGGIASNLLVELRDARDCLLNADRKAEYDRELRRELGLHNPQDEAEDIELELVEPNPPPRKATRPAAASAPPPLPPAGEIAELDEVRAPRPAMRVKPPPLPSVRPAPVPLDMEVDDDGPNDLSSAVDAPPVSVVPIRRRRSSSPLPTLIGAVGGGVSAAVVAWLFWPQIVALRNGGQPVVVEHRTEHHSRTRSHERRDKSPRSEFADSTPQSLFSSIRPEDRPPAARIKPTPETDEEMESAPPTKRSGTAMPEPEAPVQPKGPRLPALSEKETQDAILLVKRRFRDEYRGQSVDDQTALALVLVDQARKAADDPKLRYGLLLEARKAAIAAGHAELVVKSIDDLAAGFEVDPLALKVAALGEAAKNVRDEEDRLAFVDATFRTIGAAVAQQEYATASQLGGMAQSVATKLRDAETRKRVASKVAELQGLEAHIKDVAKARETIAVSPDDATANGVIGKHLCLYENKWDEGLPQLARGSDEKLAAEARQELAPPKDAAQQIEAGDFWWNFAQTEVGAPRRNTLSRAAHWYTKSASQATGINKIKIDKRLKIIAEETSQTERRWRSPLAE